jgi:hypothetical protein
MARSFADRERFAGVLRAAGIRAGLGEVARLPGGSKKGVYRLGLDDGSTVVAYVWDDEESYWPPRDALAGAVDPFADASGIELFAAAHDELTRIGVRTPRLVHLGDGVALVEDVPGGNLEVLLETDPVRGERTVEVLARMLETMRSHTAPYFGKLTVPVRTGTCAQVVLDRAMRDLDESAARDERIRADLPRLAALAVELAERIGPRREHALIHGELGPDHVLVGEDGVPMLIDIEGLMFFDVEWEHVFMQMRFGEHYRLLHAGGLDEDRLRFYRLAQHLSLVAGPLRLLDGDFPDRAAMAGIAAYHAEQVLAFT